MAAEASSQDNETSNGWPLGLMSTRFRAMETVQVGPAEPHSLRIHSSSFSSFSSSNLDTESTASFFQDNSVPLGRLIGIRPGNGGLYFPRRVHVDEREKKALRAIRAASSTELGSEMDAREKLGGSLMQKFGKPSQ
ncbi:unnamed protein product [Dovyalis caffra]|uniref:Uncharacterized protein n=1 Tax=Dovyalis caffra TaxID=77055 RepID=A0AAV1SGQ6_9ROSI|nr:unnamed protein product [Dovyalis caffra]